MKQIKWFDRKFTFPENQNIFPSIIERLQGTPIRLADKLSRIDSGKLYVRIDGWSIAEHLGHLSDLESIWQGRLADIIDKKEMLREADLSNKKTDLAEHNSRSIDHLLKEFSEVRSETLSKLEGLSEKEIYHFALHPRLRTPMRIMDLFVFVAEHDDHHLARMTEIHHSQKAK